MKLSILIVHYKTLEPLQSCLQSLMQQDFKAFEVIVVDNENHPALPEMISSFSPGVKLIQNKENNGFGRANNQAAAIAQGEVLLLLNPDTELREKDILEKLLAFQAKHPEFGVIGPKILDQGHATLLPRMFYPGLKHDKQGVFQDLPGHIAWIIGAAMLIPKKVFNEVQGFDPDYFLYGEEADLCLRIRKAGWAIGYADCITIDHIGGASEKNTNEYDYWLKKQRGLYLFYIKAYPEGLWRKLLRKELLRVRWRLLMLWFERHIVKNPHAAKKTERNSAIRDAILKTLSDTSWLK